MPVKAKTVNFKNPIYIVYVVAGVVLLWLSARTASARPTLFDRALIQVVELLPSWLNGAFTAISALGSLAFVLILSLAVLPLRHYKAGLKFFLAGTSAYLLSSYIHGLSWHSNNSFPSSQVAVVTALALVAYQYTRSSRHRFITTTVILVAIAQIYLKNYVPVDLIGGFAIGLITGSAVSYIFGRQIISRVSTKTVRKALIRNNYPVKSVKILGVDARGSSPFMATFTSGQQYFIKVVNSDNFVADWLFKLYRRIIYRRLEDESPFFSPKRQIEHESYVANLAYANGIRTPRIVGVLEVKANNWGQIQEAIDGKSLDKVDPKIITDSLLDKIFELINDLHSKHIIHRDLRAANIFLDKNKTPWLIDFGFAEASSRPSQTYRDLVEIICSLGVIVGHKRIVKAAFKNIPRQELINAIPYLQYAALSGETTRLMKLHRPLLKDIINGLKQGTNQTELKSVRVARFKPVRRQEK